VDWFLTSLWDRPSTRELRKSPDDESAQSFLVQFFFSTAPRSSSCREYRKGYFVPFLQAFFLSCLGENLQMKHSPVFVVSDSLLGILQDRLGL